MSSRDTILRAIREANAGRTHPPHPGHFPGTPIGGTGDAEERRITRFVERFTAVGGEAHDFDSRADAIAWLRNFVQDFDGVSVGMGVPTDFGFEGANSPPSTAPLGVSQARGGIAETGSVALDARDGRRAQLLPPTHVVLLSKGDVFDSMASALEAWKGDLPSAIGLHSGPSKSADIGQMMVKGVHGPGRLIALLMPAR